MQLPRAPRSHVPVMISTEPILTADPLCVLRAFHSRHELPTTHRTPRQNDNHLQQDRSAERILFESRGQFRGLRGTTGQAAVGGRDCLWCGGTRSATFQEVQFCEIAAPESGTCQPIAAFVRNWVDGGEISEQDAIPVNRGVEDLQFLGGAAICVLTSRAGASTLMVAWSARGMRPSTTCERDGWFAAPKASSPRSRVSARASKR
jgi:hypothetical protein